ncbi:MAG: NfeD family protein, partial [Prevotella sp.]|nr:NfeD family protein [Prevotella sp.]
AFAATSAAFGAGFYVQLGVFAVFTLVSLFLVRPFALRYLHRNDENRVSNADALLGRKGRVVEQIEADGFGRVQIDGDVWKAVTKDGEAIPVGANVRVVDRESIIITVEEVKG